MLPTIGALYDRVIVDERQIVILCHSNTSGSRGIGLVVS